MKLSTASVTLAIGLVVLLASNAVWAQVPTAAPVGSTGLCKDGSFSSNATRKGACAGHQGVKQWFAAAATLPAKPATSPAAATASTAPMAAPSNTSSKASQNASTNSSPKAASNAAPVEATKTAAAPAAGGGPGLVWVNTPSKVYHCAGSRYYGKTRQGEYMTEAAAKAAGDHADHGKACTS